MVREQIHTDERSAILEIDVEEVKNDMVRGNIGSAVTFFPEAEHQAWFDPALGEVEQM